MTLAPPEAPARPVRGTRAERLGARRGCERQALAVLCALLAVLLAWQLAVRGGSATVMEPSADRAEAAARRFLDTYVDADGRVVRRDNGGDTVSEGQAYGLLLAVAIGDQATFDRVWSWTRAALQRDDGLFAWLWRDGAVRDDGSAADADVDIAHALLLAADRFAQPSYRDEAVRIATSVRTRETRGIDGLPVLMAGPWTAGGVAAINPSYFDPRAFARLGEATGDPEWWSALTAGGYRVVDQLLAGDAVLPPDWAGVGPGRVEAVGGVNVEGEPRYGYDAARLPVRFAVACDRTGRGLAADWWPVFADLAPGEIVESYDLTGRPVGTHRTPLTVVGAAASAHAAGDHDAAAALLDAAERLDADVPTYYGAAWVALGRVLLTTDRLGACP